MGGTNVDLGALAVLTGEAEREEPAHLLSLPQKLPTTCTPSGLLPVCVATGAAFNGCV